MEQTCSPPGLSTYRVLPTCSASCLAQACLLPGHRAQLFQPAHSYVASSLPGTFSQANPKLPTSSPPLACVDRSRGVFPRLGLQSLLLPVKPARIGTSVESPVRGTLLECKQEIGGSHSHLRLKKKKIIQVLRPHSKR